MTTTPSAAALKKLSDKVAELRDCELSVQELQERLKLLNSKIYHIEREELPELMAEAEVDSIGIPASGNLPAYDLKLKPFYNANIAASWEPERREAAFAYLEANNAGDLIKTQIIINIPREKRAEAKRLAAKLADYAPEVKASVHSATLTSWLKEKSEGGDAVDLEKIGGQVGTIVKPKARREKNG